MRPASIHRIYVAVLVALGIGVLAVRLLAPEAVSWSPARLIGAYGMLFVAWYAAWQLTLQGRDQVLLTILGAVSVLGAWLGGMPVAALAGVGLMFVLVQLRPRQPPPSDSGASSA